MTVGGESDFAQAVGDFLYQQAGGLPGVLGGVGYGVTKAGSAAKSAVSGFSKSLKTKTKKSKGKRIENPAKCITDKAYTPAATRVKSKKNKKRPRAKSVLSKKERKAIKRMVDRPEYVLVRVDRDHGYFDFGSDYNKVEYADYHNLTVQNYIEACDWEVRDPQSATGGKIAQTISITDYMGQRLRVKVKCNVKIYNNSNMPGEVRFAHFLCRDFNDTTPIQEMQRMRDARYSSATTSLAIEDDPGQYWGVPGQNRADWKLHKQHTITLRGGENSQVYFETPWLYIDVDRWIEESSKNYKPGLSYISMRIIGVPTHLGTVTSAATTGRPALFQSQAIGAFRFDMHSDKTTIFEVLEAGDPLNIYQVPVVSGLVTPGTANAADAPVAADPEDPGVEPPEQG